MSLLRRNSNDDKKQQNNNTSAKNNTNAGNQNNKPNLPPLPSSKNNGQSNSSSSSSSSRFGRGNNNNNSGSSRFGGQKKEQEVEKSWRYDGTVNRFGASDVAWVIAPINTTFVRFDLKGLGDPFHRLLGAPLDLNHADPANFAQTLITGGDLTDELTQRLDESWEIFNMTGAIMMFAWDDMRKAIVAHLPELQKNTAVPNPFNRKKDDDKEESANEELPASGMCLRALDMTLIINVLARTKSNILLGNSELILEDAFINRSLVTNDPRLVQLAQATGCIEERFDK